MKDTDTSNSINTTNTKSDIITAPVITYSRHRILSDGNGITTLVCFHGCPLRCKYCLNPFSYKEETKKKFVSPDELYNELKIDDLYFTSTNGGVTFGGGEPLLYPDFIASFCDLSKSRWHNNIETSLNVPWKNVEKVINSIDVFFIDCKDTNPEIYSSYTQKSNDIVIENLKKLSSMIPPERIVVRVPLIPNHNTEEDRIKSIELLTELGIRHFDKFDYVIK